MKTAQIQILHSNVKNIWHIVNVVIWRIPEVMYFNCRLKWKRLHEALEVGLCCMSPTKDIIALKVCHPIFIIYVVKAPLNPHPHNCYAAARSRPAGCSIIMNGHWLLVHSWMLRLPLIKCDEVIRHLTDIFNNRLSVYILVSSLNTRRCWSQACKRAPRPLCLLLPS